MLYEQVRAYWAESFGENYLYTLTTDLALGGVLIRARRFEEAEARLTRAYRALEAHRGRADRYTQEAVQHLVRLYESWGRPGPAAAFRERLTDLNG